jgi:ubiquinone/menaquinone biosynthesis C-methylase UbiE
VAEQTLHNRNVIDQHTLQASGYAALTQSAPSDRTTALRKLAGVSADDIVLDLACGPGSLALDLAPHVAQVTGLDLTPAMLDQARKAQIKAGVDNISWQVGDAAALPFADSTFSLIASRAAFHHFEEPAAVLAEMARVCRPGGRVVVIDVTPETGKTPGYDRLELMRDTSHHHAHSLDELRQMGMELGLELQATETRISGPMAYEAVLATSYPKHHSKDELRSLMRQDAESGSDGLGFKAEMIEGEVFVSYAMSTLVWTRSQ